MDDMFDKLAAPFSPDAISWRVGSTNQDKTKGIALAYLDARDVMERLDAVCGPAGWQNSYSHTGSKTVCDISIKCDGEWIAKSDGAGDSDIEAEKGALSDAFKRAAVRWGVGRYLYGLSSPWVELEPAGRSQKIKQSEYPKLRALLTAYTGVTRKSSAQAKRDKDYEYFKGKIEEATDLEALGALGRELKQALPSLPVAFHDPLRDLYDLRRNELVDAQKEPGSNG
jgi:hypothetical protein